MILYSRSETAAVGKSATAWTSVNIKPDYFYIHGNHEEELAFIWSYLIYGMIHRKRDTYFLVVL